MKKFIVLTFCSLSLMAFGVPDLMLLKTYRNQDLTGWVMSEKLDGIRGYWDGKVLYTRQQKILTPPHYFLKNFPPFAIDGELFTQRNDFANIASIVKSKKDQGWQGMKLYVFDVPDSEGDLFQRLEVLEAYLKENPAPHIAIIPQIKIASREVLTAFYQDIIENQGEGVVVRNPNAPYERKRSSQILKIKPVEDEECQVVAHHEGKGKYQGRLGAITCENKRGKFKIGSGFKDKDRQDPPPIGSIITYRYRGLTKSGLPRFATFYRLKETPNF